MGQTHSNHRYTKLLVALSTLLFIAAACSEPPEGNPDDPDLGSSATTPDDGNQMAPRDMGAEAPDDGLPPGPGQDMAAPPDMDTPGDMTACTPGTPAPGRLVCNPDDLEYLYTSDECGNPMGRSATRCFGKKKCEEHAATGEASCSCPLTGNLTCRASNANFPGSLVDDTYVVRERECANSSELDPADIVETCGFGSVCFVDDFDGPGHVPRNGGEAFCARSVTNMSSPYFDFGCTKNVPEHLRYPTALEIDCRCRVKSVPGSQANGGTGSRPADPSDFDVSMSPLAHPKGKIMNCSSPAVYDRFDWPIA